LFFALAALQHQHGQVSGQEDRHRTIKDKKRTEQHGPCPHSSQRHTDFARQQWRRSSPRPWTLWRGQEGHLDLWQSAAPQKDSGRQVLTRPERPGHSKSEQRDRVHVRPRPRQPHKAVWHCARFRAEGAAWWWRGHCHGHRAGRSRLTPQLPEKGAQEEEHLAGEEALLVCVPDSSGYGVFGRQVLDS